MARKSKPKANVKLKTGGDLPPKNNPKDFLSGGVIRPRPPGASTQGRKRSNVWLNGGLPG